MIKVTHINTVCRSVSKRTEVFQFAKCVRFYMQKVYTRTSSSFSCSVMSYHNRFSNRFIYHTDFILCHSYYLLFNCLNYSSSLELYTPRERGWGEMRSDPCHDASKLRTNECQLLSFYLKLFECCDFLSPFLFWSATKKHKQHIGKWQLFALMYTLIFHYSSFAWPLTLSPSRLVALISVNATEK